MTGDSALNYIHTGQNLLKCNVLKLSLYLYEILQQIFS